MCVICSGGWHQRKSRWSWREGGLMTRSLTLVQWLVCWHMNDLQSYPLNFYIYHMNPTGSRWHRGEGGLWTHWLTLEWCTCTFHVDLYITWMRRIHVSRDSDFMCMYIIWIYLSYEWVAIICIYVSYQVTMPLCIYITWICMYITNGSQSQVYIYQMEIYIIWMCRIHMSRDNDSVINDITRSYEPQSQGTWIVS